MSTFYIKCKNDDIVHYGVLGMKWGIRRYQNPDGSLTNKGRRKYLSDLEKRRRQELRKIRKENPYLWGTGYIKRQELLNKAEKKYDIERVKSARNEKEKFKEYERVFSKKGLPYSQRDVDTGLSGQNWMRYIRQKEGKEYSDSVIKSVQNKTLFSIGASTAVAVGSYFLITQALKQRNLINEAFENISIV